MKDENMHVIVTTLFGIVIFLLCRQSAVSCKVNNVTISTTQENQINNEISKGHLEFSEGENLMRANYDSQVIHRNIFGFAENSGFHDTEAQPKALFKPPYENRSFFQYITLEGRRLISLPLDQSITFFTSSRGELYQNQVSKIYRRKFTHDISNEKRKATVSLDPQAGLEWNGPSLNLLESADMFIQPSGKLFLTPRRTIGNQDHQIEVWESMMHLNSLNLDPFLSQEIRETAHYVVGGEVAAPLGFLGNMSFRVEKKFILTHENDEDEEGLDHSLSDFIGSIEVNVSDWLILNGQINYNRHSLKPVLSDLGISFVSNLTNLTISYELIDDPFISDLSENFETEEISESTQARLTPQISLFLSSKLTEKVSFNTFITRDLKMHNPLTFQIGTGFYYGKGQSKLGFTIDHQNFPGTLEKPETRFIMSFGIIF